MFVPLKGNRYTLSVGSNSVNVVCFSSKKGSTLKENHLFHLGVNVFCLGEIPFQKKKKKKKKKKTNKKSIQKATEMAFLGENCEIVYQPSVNTTLKNVDSALIQLLESTLNGRCFNVVFAGKCMKSP